MDVRVLLLDAAVASYVYSHFCLQDIDAQGPLHPHGFMSIYASRCQVSNPMRLCFQETFVERVIAGVCGELLRLSFAF